MTAFEPIYADKILLQHPPFRYVDLLIIYKDGVARTRFTVPTENILVEDGRFTSAGVMEHMAQSSAARVGFEAKYIHNIPVQIGFIGQIKNFEMMRFPRSGETLETEVKTEYEMMGITLASITVYINNEPVARGQLKTAIKQE